MARAISFSDLVDMTDALSLGEKEALLEVLRQRTLEERRELLGARVRQARKEHRAGKYKAVRAADMQAELER